MCYFINSIDVVLLFANILNNTYLTRVSQLWYYGHFGPENSKLLGALLSIRGFIYLFVCLFVCF